MPPIYWWLPSPAIWASASNSVSPTTIFPRLSASDLHNWSHSADQSSLGSFWVQLMAPSFFPPIRPRPLVSWCHVSLFMPNPKSLPCFQEHPSSIWLFLTITASTTSALCQLVLFKRLYFRVFYMHLHLWWECVFGDSNRYENLPWLLSALCFETESLTGHREDQFS